MITISLGATLWVQRVVGVIAIARGRAVEPGVDDLASSRCSTWVSPMRHARSEATTRRGATPSTVAGATVIVGEIVESGPRALIQCAALSSDLPACVQAGR